MENNELQYLLDNSKPIELAQGEDEVVDLAGYQVTKAEFFAHIREPAVTIWENRLKFNMACLRRFPGVTHIQILIHPEQKRLIIRPCDPDTPDSLRWAIGGGEIEIKNRELLCKLFAARIFDLMQWNLCAPRPGDRKLPKLPVIDLPDIIASGNKSEQERTPRDGCS